MTKNLLPHLLIFLDDSIITPSLLEFLHKGCELYDTGIGNDFIAIYQPITTNFNTVDIETTSRHFCSIIVNILSIIRKSKIRIYHIPLSFTPDLIQNESHFVFQVRRYEYQSK